ncbi:hypothetical protein [Herbaspirillum huttiense]|uniref:hypothetical protein n=1 Tax=Herbaspirillum huttiense TaxID=863372 RepID=UPI0031D12F9E
MTIEKKGGVSIPLLECIFHQGISTTHFTYDFEPSLYDLLENLYIIVVANNSYRPRSIPVGIVVKTSYTHEDPEFLSAVCSLLSESQNVAKHFDPEVCSLLPMRLKLSHGKPITENEMLYYLQMQYFKFAPSGNS